MDEDEEEFYDSLDEDQNFEDILEIPIVDNEIVPKNDLSETSVYESVAGAKKEHSKTTKIPLYVGETDKRDLKINQKSNPNVASANQILNTCFSCEISGKSKVKIDNILPKRKPESSYWNIYCQKNGFQIEDENNTDTVRSLYGSPTNRTFSSFISSCCLSGNTWDAPSMFEKYMPKTYATQKNESSIYGDIDETSSVTKCNSTEIDVDNLKSVSEIEIVKGTSSATPSKKSSNKVMKCKSNTSNISLRPLTLKTLSPDQTKLDLIKRQHEYGHKASSRNRARIIQNLSKLNQEIQESSKEKIDIL